MSGDVEGGAVSEDVEARWFIEDGNGWDGSDWYLVSPSGNRYGLFERDDAEAVLALQAQADLAAGLRAKAELADEWFGQRAYVDPDDGHAEHMDVGVALDDLGAFCAFGCSATGKQVIERHHDVTCILTRYDALNPQPHHEEPTPADLTEDGKPVTDADVDLPLIGPQPWKHGGA